jgi:quinolinate synthase
MIKFYVTPKKQYEVTRQNQNLDYNMVLLSGVSYPVLEVLINSDNQVVLLIAGENGCMMTKMLYEVLFVGFKKRNGALNDIVYKSNEDDNISVSNEVLDIPKVPIGRGKK